MSRPLSRSGRLPVPARRSPAAQPSGPGDTTTTTASAAALTITSTATYPSTVTSTSTAARAGSMVSMQAPKTDVERLQEVAQAGDRQALQALLERGININSKDQKDGKSALHVLAESDDVEALRLLSEFGADINLKDDQGRTPLILAAAQGNLAAVRALVEAGASIELECDKRQTPFLHAASGGHMEVMQYLKESGCNIEHVAVSYCPDMGTDAMRCAAAAGHVQAIRLLHSWGLSADGSEKLPAAHSPMYYALYYDHAEAAKTLAELQAKPLTKNDSLYVCVSRGNLKATQLLLDWGDDPNHIFEDPLTEEQFPVLWAAVGQGGTEVFQLLLRRGAKLDEGLFESSPLLEAAKWDRADTVRLLVNEHHMDVNVRAKVRAETALIAASAAGLQKTVEVLLELGADPQLCDSLRHHNAADKAVRAGHSDILRVLASYGARPQQSEIDLAMQIAIHKGDGNPAMVQTLIEIGYQPTEKDVDYATAKLPYNPQVIDLLLEQVWTGSSLADAPQPEQFFRDLLNQGADSHDSDDSADGVDDGSDHDSSDGFAFELSQVQPLARKGLRSGLWQLLTSAPDAFHEVLPALTTPDTSATSEQELAWFCSLLPSMDEPRYEEIYPNHPALAEAARKQYADVMTAASKLVDKLVVGRIPALQIRCIKSLVLGAEPIESIALMFHQEAALLMPVANLLADCWKCAIEKAGELQVTGKLKDLARTLEQQILPYLVQELKSLVGRPGFYVVPSGDVPEAYYLMLNQQLQFLAEYRKALEQRILPGLPGSLERNADYA